MTTFADRLLPTSLDVVLAKNARTRLVGETSTLCTFPGGTTAHLMYSSGEDHGIRLDLTGLSDEQVRLIAEIL